MIWALDIGLLLFSTALVSAGERLSFDKGVMVHLMEWKYEDIAHECEDFLQPLEFAAVLISPPSENIVKPKRPWSERYEPVSYNLITRSGDEEELKKMLRRCNSVGVRVVADVVLNHMTADDENCVGTGQSECNPKDFSYPAVPYGYDDFHHSSKITKECFKDAAKIRNCDLDGKHDLDQSRPNVQEIQAKYLNHLISIGIAGFKINAAKHMEPAHLTVILGKLDNLNVDHYFPTDTKPFVYLEMIDNDQEPISYKEYLHLGLVTDYKYGNQLGLHISNNRLGITQLQGFGELPKWNMIPSDTSVVFVDSHDTQHGSLFPNHINFQQSKYYKIAVAFMLAWTWGTPVLMSSYRFKDKAAGPPSDQNGNIISPKIDSNICDLSIGWVCEHRWRQIFNMVEFHNVVKGTEVKEWQGNGQANQISFCRGDKGFIMFNMEQSPFKGTRQTCLPEGTYCDIIEGELKVDGTCSSVEVNVDSKGEANIQVPGINPHKDGGGILAIHVDSKKGLIKEPKKYVPPQYSIAKEDIQPQEESPPPKISTDTPEQAKPTAYFKGDYDIFEQGHVFETGFHRGYENVEITLKFNLAQEWLENLVKNGDKTQ